MRKRILFILLGIIVSLFVFDKFNQINQINMINTATMVLCSIIFMITYTSKDRIKNAGIKFIGLSLPAIIIFSFLFMATANSYYFTQEQSVNYFILNGIKEIYLILILFVGFLVFYQKTKVKEVRVLAINAVIIASILVFLFVFKVFPDTLEQATFDLIELIISYTLTVGYITLFIIVFVKTSKDDPNRYIVLSVFGLLLIGYIYVPLPNDYLDVLLSFQYLLLIGGFGLLTYYFYVIGFKKPYEDTTFELNELKDKYHESKRVDELTLISNRKFLFENIDKSFRLAKREKHGIGFVMIDIDDFRQYNDLLGHMHGDSILKRVAKAVEHSCMRPLDVAGRYGGEEFLIVLPNSDYAGTIVVCERIMKQIHELRINHYKTADKFLTVSIGFCVMKPVQTDTVDDAIKVADDFLYKVKNTGKNAYMGIDLEKGDSL